MFDHEQKDLAATLAQMERLAREKSNFNQTAAREKMAEWIAQDRRFDGLDPEKLVARVQDCRSRGAVFDITDPSLAKGGSPRPLAGRYGTGRY
jgi:hypothetical protein